MSRTRSYFRAWGPTPTPRARATNRARGVGLGLGTTAALLVFTLFSRASAPPVSREALDVTFDAGIRRLVIEWDAADQRPADRAPPGAVRLHVPDLSGVRLDPAVALRQQCCEPGGDGRRGHDRWREGRPRALARQPAGAGLRHGAERRPRRARRPGRPARARSSGRSTAWSATWPRSTAWRILARAPRRSTSCGSARR